MKITITETSLPRRGALLVGALAGPELMATAAAVDKRTGKPQRLAALDLEFHAVDGLNVGDLPLEDDAGRDREVHPDVADPDDGVVTGTGGGYPRCLLYSHTLSSYAGVGDLAA